MECTGNLTTPSRKLGLSADADGALPWLRLVNAEISWRPLHLYRASHTLVARNARLPSDRLPGGSVRKTFRIVERGPSTRPGTVRGEHRNRQCRASDSYRANLDASVSRVRACCKAGWPASTLWLSCSIAPA